MKIEQTSVYGKIQQGAKRSCRSRPSRFIQSSHNGSRTGVQKLHTLETMITCSLAEDFGQDGTVQVSHH